MSSRALSADAAPLPGQAQDLALDDLDEVQLTSIRSPAALLPLALRKAAGPLLESKPTLKHESSMSLHSVVTRASAVSHVAGQQKKRLPTVFWFAELFFFLCFICVLSALLIESRDTTSIYTCAAPSTATLRPATSTATLRPATAPSALPPQPPPSALPLHPPPYLPLVLFIL